MCAFRVCKSYAASPRLTQQREEAHVHLGVRVRVEVNVGVSEVFTGSVL